MSTDFAIQSLLLLILKDDWCATFTDSDNHVLTIIYKYRKLPDNIKMISHEAEMAQILNYFLLGELTDSISTFAPKAESNSGTADAYLEWQTLRLLLFSLERMPKKVKVVALTMKWHTMTGAAANGAHTWSSQAKRDGQQRRPRQKYEGS